MKTISTAQTAPTPAVNQPTVYTADGYTPLPTTVLAYSQELAAHTEAVDYLILARRAIAAAVAARPSAANVELVREIQRLTCQCRDYRDYAAKQWIELVTARVAESARELAGQTGGEA